MSLAYGQQRENIGIFKRFESLTNSQSLIDRRELVAGIAKI